MKTQVELLKEFKTSQAYVQSGLYEDASHVVQQIADKASREGDRFTLAADGGISVISNSGQLNSVLVDYDKDGRVVAKCARGFTMF